MDLSVLNQGINVFSRSVLLEGIIGGKTFGTKLLDNKNFNSTWLNQVDKIILTASNEIPA